MVITVSIKESHSFNKVIEYLKDIGVFQRLEELYLKDTGRTYVSLEVMDSEIASRLFSIEKDKLYLMKLTDKGISLFTTSEDDTRIFIPMCNIKAISNYSELKNLYENLYS